MNSRVREGQGNHGDEKSRTPGALSRATPVSRDSGVALVLSGGGAKAAAHVGAARAIAELGIRPALYVGTSMGAVVAAALAAGMAPGDLAQKLATSAGGIIAKRTLVALRGLTVPSLLRPEPLRRMIEAVVPARRFSELATPLAFTAVDLDSGAQVVFGEGGEDAPLVDALVASCALSFYYPPVLLGGRRLADGGLRGVLPLELAARPGITRVVAVDLGGNFEEGIAPSMTLPLRRAHDEAMSVLLADNTALRLALWRASTDRPPLVHIRPRIVRGTTFRPDLAESLMTEGYRAAREALAAP